jgi:hypothetical protein
MSAKVSRERLPDLIFPQQRDAARIRGEAIDGRAEVKLRRRIPSEVAA